MLAFGILNDGQHLLFRNTKFTIKIHAESRLWVAIFVDLLQNNSLQLPWNSFQTLLPIVDRFRARSTLLVFISPSTLVLVNLGDLHVQRSLGGLDKAVGKRVGFSCQAHRPRPIQSSCKLRYGHRIKHELKPRLAQSSLCVILLANASTFSRNHFGRPPASSFARAFFIFSVDRLGGKDPFSNFSSSIFARSAASRTVNFREVVDEFLQIGHWEA